MAERRPAATIKPRARGATPPAAPPSTLNAGGLNRTLFIADNLPILRGIDSESIDLIATDPPFNKGVKAFEGIVAAGAGRKGTRVSYKDVWTWRDDVQGEWEENIREDHSNLHAVIEAANVAAGDDMGAFLCWLGVRVLEMHRVLKPTGSLYLHIDHTAHAYTKAMLDAIFGRQNFQNELVWYYGGGGASQRRFGRKHDTILFYSKTSKWNFNLDDVRVPHKWVDGQLRADGSERSERGKIPDDVMKIPDDVIELHGVMPWAKERTGYPTQKPLALYERIIKASSNEGTSCLTRSRAAPLRAWRRNGWAATGLPSTSMQKRSGSSSDACKARQRSCHLGAVRGTGLFECSRGRPNGRTTARWRPRNSYWSARSREAQR